MMRKEDDRVPTGRIVFIGAVHEAHPALQALLEMGADVAAVVTLTHRRTEALAGGVDLEPLATSFGVPVLRTENLNDRAEVERLRALSPDLLVVVGWTRLLGTELLQVPQRGCVGFHASLLPHHRGRAPVNWAILRGETFTGNTMMFLDPGADTGDIIGQRRVDITPEDTCATVYAKVAAAGAEMLREHLPALLAGRAPRRPQDPHVGDLLPKRTPEMGITDFDRPARAVHDWIRALTEPYPGAFGFVGATKLFLWRSAVPGPDCAEAPPGVIVGCDAEALRVATADRVLRILLVQEEGGPKEPGASWYLRRSGSAGPASKLRFAPADRATSRWALGLEGATGSAFSSLANRGGS